MEKIVNFTYPDTGKQYRGFVAVDTDETTIIGVNWLRVFAGIHKSVTGNHRMVYNTLEPGRDGYDDVYNYILTTIVTA